MTPKALAVVVDSPGSSGAAPTDREESERVMRAHQALFDVGKAIAASARSVGIVTLLETNEEEEEKEKEGRERRGERVLMTKFLLDVLLLLVVVHLSCYMGDL